MRHVFPCLLYFIFFGMFSVPNGFAQMNPMWSSIDLRVAQSDTVVIGHVVSAGQPFGNEATNERRQPFILAVDETLKGHANHGLSLTAEHDVLRDMERAGLLCDGCAKKHVKFLVMLTHPSGVTRTDVVLLGPAVMDVTAGLEILTRPEDLLREVRSEIEREPGVLSSSKVTTWTFSPLLKGTYFMSYTIYVPIDDRAEQIAHRVLALCKAEHPTNDFTATPCREAIFALRSFKNPNNVDMLEQFLSDPYRIETNKGSFYPIRSAAKQVLTEWGAKPIVSAEPEN